MNNLTRDASASQNDLAARSFCDDRPSHYEGIPYEYIEGGQCVVCGEPFEGSHLAVKTTCSDKCRQKLKRYREGIGNKFEAALDIISFYEDMFSIPELEGQARKRLALLQSLISEVLEGEGEHEQESG